MADDLLVIIPTRGRPQAIPEIIQVWDDTGATADVLFAVDTDDPDGGDGATRFVELDDTPLPIPPKGLVPIVAPAGTMVILHGLLPHWSDVNRSPSSRHAYSLHCISESADYPAWNWLQRPPSMPLRRLDRVAATAR